MISREAIFEFNEFQKNKTKPFVLSEDGLKNYLRLNKKIQYINSCSQLNPFYNSSIVYPLYGYNYVLNNNERVPMKNNISSIYNLKTFKTNFKNNISNNDQNNNYTDMYIKKIDISKINNNNVRNKRTLSYGNLKIKIKKNNERYKIFPNKTKNNNNLSNTNFINNTRSFKKILPSYSFISPNGYICPIIIANNNENYINNNNMNNNIDNIILYNFQNNSSINSNTYKRYKPKPSLQYYNTFTQKNLLSELQNINNGYNRNFKKIKIQKHLNNSSNYNSIQINNNFPDNYLNKQIFNFINSNSHTKKDIKINLNKMNFHMDSNGSTKLNNATSSLNENWKKNNKRKTNNYLTMRENDVSQLFPNMINYGASNKKLEIQKFENIPLQYSARLNNNIKDIFNLSQNKKSINIKTENYGDINNIKSYPYKFKIKRNIIDDINRIKINKNNSKKKSNRNLIKKNDNNFSIEQNIKLIEKQNNNDYSDLFNNKILKENINNNINVSNFYNGNETIEQNQYSYNINNNNVNNINYNFDRILSFNNIYDKNIMPNYSTYRNYNYMNNKIIKKLSRQNDKNYFIKKNKNFKFQNVSKEMSSINNKNKSQYSISFSTLNSNRNKKKIIPSQYEISSNVVDEQIITKNNLEEKEEKNNNGNNDSYEMSLQSINDSKILELANRYVNDGRILDKEKINEILSDKSSKKITKIFKK